VTETFVGRKPDPERRAELLDDVVGYLLEHGIHQTSLRPLATGLGTSTYTFVYHFGSKEELVTEVLEAIADRHAAALESLRAGSIEQLVRSYWEWNLVDDKLRQAKVIADARSLVRVAPELYRPFLRSIRTALESRLARQLEASGRSADDAAIVATAIDGALSDVASQEHPSVDSEAVARLLERVA
jgi:AcrR family transcriptional regulator